MSYARNGSVGELQWTCTCIFWDDSICEAQYQSNNISSHLFLISAAPEAIIAGGKYTGLHLPVEIDNWAKKINTTEIEKKKFTP